MYEEPFIRFYGDSINRPDAKRAALVFDDFCRYTPDVKIDELSKSILRHVYREDLYDRVNSSVVNNS